MPVTSPCRRRSSRVFLLLPAVVLIALPPSATAQTDAPTTIPPVIPSAPPTAAPTTVASAPADISLTGPTTRVAPVKNGKVGAKVTVYKTASTKATLATLVNGTNVKGRVVFTVIEDMGDWLKVNAPIRANGGIGYVRTADIDLQFIHRWRITVELGARRLSVYRGDELMDTETIAVGAAKTPTPTGRFYTVDLLRPKGGGSGPYGAYAYGISAFSAVYQRFGAGDGRIGIHGTNDPSKLGQAVSNGCIRMSNDGITKLQAMLPLGVPVEITA